MPDLDAAISAMNAYVEWRKAFDEAPYDTLDTFLVKQGWTPPPPPKPVIEVSIKAMAAYHEADEYETGFRAAFKVMLRDALEKLPDSTDYLEAKRYNGPTDGGWIVRHRRLYRTLTGEEWPDA